MDKDKIKLYKERLLEEKCRLERLMDRMENKEPTYFIEEYKEELSNYDNHPADLGTEMFMMEHDMGLKNKNHDVIEEIYDSLEKIEKGTFGICESCGNSIEEDRLYLIPYTKLCISCSNEKISSEGNKSVLPEIEISRYPFGESHIDELCDKEVEFNREDSYQEVAKYNKVDNDPSFATGDDLGVLDKIDEGIVEDVEKISKDYYKDTI